MKKILKLKIVCMCKYNKQEEINGLEGRSCELETDTHVIQKLTNPK